MSEPNGFDIRYTEETDYLFLENLFLDEMSFDPFPFEFEQKDQALKNWIGYSKYKASLTGTLQNIPCAIGTLFLMPYKKVAHHCSFYLIVDPSYRNQGIGTSMVKNLLHLARERFKLESMHVEIYEPNPLMSIVKKLNFEEFARQDGFLKIGTCTKPRVLLEHFFIKN